MNVPMIEMPVEKARAAFEEYRAAWREKHGADDELLMRGYKALVEGKQLLDVEVAMKSGGLDERGRPRLAICRASAPVCHFTVQNAHRDGGTAIFCMERIGWRERGSCYKRVTMPAKVFGGSLTRNDLKAIVPSIPPRLRPKAALCHYHILWEAEWEEVPRDPILLRHIGRSLYAVLAHWDLTDLEMAVLKGRADA